MSKKLILACMALVALAAFALPAAASAKPRLCETEGATCTTLATGVKIHAHNVGIFKITTSNTSVLLECSTATMTGTLTKNNAEDIEATIESATFTGTGAGGKCTSALLGNTTITTRPAAGETWIGLPYCLTAGGAEDKFSVRGGACNEAARAITFVLHTTNIGVCRYTRSTAIEGTFTTHTSSSEDAILTISHVPEGAAKFTKEAVSGVLCPEAVWWDLQMTLTTDNSPTFTTLYIENV
jgi:hypothetical protein